MLNLADPRADIQFQVRKALSLPILKGGLFAHLHCYDISKFREIYGNYIGTIYNYFSVVVTYSLGIARNVMEGRQIALLKIPNKGMDIGAKFCMVQYLRNQKIDYSYILFLHSKSNPKTRRKYFAPLISNFKEEETALEFIENINNYDGYFPDIQWEICGNRLKMISGNPKFASSNLPERNLLYRKELLGYLGCGNRTNRFIEGNVYILSKKVVERLFGDKRLYNILNRPHDFDYNWVCARYGLSGSLRKVYHEFRIQQLQPRDKLSYDGYIEHAFERVVLNLCESNKLMNKNINLIGITNINCSISENVYLLKKYLENKSHNIVEVFDINNLRNINYNASETIFCLQPFELKQLGPHLIKYKVKPSVLWIWEFKSLPDIFKKYEKYFSKVYVQSQFCYDVFSKHLSIPIEKVNLKSPIHEYIDKIGNHSIKNTKVKYILKKNCQ